MQISFVGQAELHEAQRFGVLGNGLAAFCPTYHCCHSEEEKQNVKFRFAQPRHGTRECQDAAWAGSSVRA
jgi:hypothetical protein